MSRVVPSNRKCVGQELSILVANSLEEALALCRGRVPHQPLNNFPIPVLPSSFKVGSA